MPNTSYRTRARRRNRRRFRPSERREMVRLVLEEGRPINSVAREFGTGWTTVKYWIDRAQFIEAQSQTSAGSLVANAVMNPVGGYRFISDEQKAEALRLVLDEGMPATAAAARTGIAHTTISRWLRETCLDGQSVSRPQWKPADPAPMDEQAVDSSQSQPSADSPLPETPVDTAPSPGSMDELSGLREQVMELQLERDFLRLIVVHLISPTTDASGIKVTFTAD